MQKIWSDNRYIELMINMLLFLTGINFLHYGQLILPIICFILFVDNKLKFKVNNPKIFILLCLFAISFYAFSYQLGFYSVMGFCMPMAYYIGSNMKYSNAENIKRVVLLLAIAMALHIFLNVIYEIASRGLDRTINSSSHYDIFTRDKMSTTITAINLVYLICSFYYLLFEENNKLIKYSSLFIFFIDLAYCLIIGRRTTLFLFVICLAFSFIYNGYLNNDLKGYLKKGLSLSFSVILVLLILVGIICLIDAEALFDADGLYLIEKLKSGLFDESRISIFFAAIKLLPYHLWGGQEISKILGVQIHELWLDVYDYAGIVTYILLLIYTYFFIRNIIRVFKMKMENKYKVLFMCLYLAIVIQMFLEPMMTGASLFLLISVIYNTLLEGLKDE